MKCFSRKQLTAKSHELILQNSSILEVRLGTKYTLSIELLLARFHQSNKFRKKSTKKIQGHLTNDATSSVIRALKVLRINLPGTFLGHQIRTSPGRHFGTSPGWSNRIFRGTSWGSWRGMSWGPVFADWEGR